MPLFTDDDRGKPVENEAGERVGTIETVEGDVAHVKPDFEAVDSIKSSIGWDSRAETLPLDGDVVGEVTDEAVRLEGGLERLEFGSGSGPAAAESAEGESDASRTEPAGGMSGTDETDLSEEMADEETVGEGDSGDEGDSTELTDDVSGFEVNPDDLDDDFQRTDAAVDPSEDRERTDAEVDPDEELEPTDAEVDPADERDGDR